MAANPNVVDTTSPEAIVPDTSAQAVVEPMINVEVQDRLLRELKRRLFPNDVEGILYSAIVGDLYWQDQLWSLMVETWPRLLTNLGKLKQAVSSMEYAITPYAQADQEPTDGALEKADFVRDALFGMHGDIAFQQHDFKETLEDIVDSIIAGFTVMEVYWEQRNGGIVPQCTRWLPARYYRFPYILDDADRLMLNPSGMLGGTQLVDFPPYKFLVAIKQSHANHPVFTAPMRCLSAWWIASRFGLEWFMTFAQLFGIPRRIAYYKPGDQLVYQQLQQMMRQSAAATWGIFPEGTKVEDQTAAGATSSHMPQERLIDEADKVCDIMLLGQTLTTEVRESGGNRALGTVHRKVMDEVMEAAAKYCAKLITTQIIPGILQYNYGNTDELPRLEPVVNTPIDLFNLAQSYDILFNRMRIPVLNKELYARIEFTPPDEGDDVYQPPAAPAPESLSPFGAPQPAQPNGLKPEPAGSPNGEQPPALKSNVVERVGASNGHRVGAAFDPGEARDEEGKWTSEGGGEKPDLSSAKESTVKTGTLFHGTNEGYASMKGSEVYLTPNKEQALNYGRNVHKLGLPAVNPEVKEMYVKGGKSLDINGPLEQGMEEGRDIDEVINHATSQARASGYHFLEFDHPNAGKEGYHHVVIALHPQDDLTVYNKSPEASRGSYVKLNSPKLKIKAGNGDDIDPDNDIDPDDWVCECGAKLDPVSSEWRCAGQYWEHYHGYPIGHVRVEAARHERRHPKTGRFIPMPTAPKRKVGVKAQPQEPTPEVGLMCKENVDMGDAKVCQACQDISDEGWIPVDEEFLGYSMNAPHHPNCRCKTEFKTVYRGVNIFHETKSGNPHHHPATGRFVSKPKRA